VNERQLIGLPNTAAAWRVAAHARGSSVAVIGYFYTGAPEISAHLMSAFRDGLSEAGYIEGRNVVRVAVIFVSAPVAALATKAATTTIPIVFRVSADPVELGLVASLSHPGGNMTGVHAMSWDDDGEHPADMPVLRAGKFEFVSSNGQRARSRNPPTLLAREVIE
jgi:putative ABC transport system substrate-binding protein